eukprot:Gb_34990 [translate_table: standard]
MAKLAEHHNFGIDIVTTSQLMDQIQALHEFSKTGKPIWGTCAGLILLANKAIGQKTGGQALLGGLDCTVHRNFFGSQLNSFETALPVPVLATKEGGPATCRAVFIRAPAILEAGPSVEVLADYTIPSNESAKLCPTSANEGKVQAGEKVIVAVKQGSMLGTAFHPELTSDTRWHSLFLKMLDESGSASLSTFEAKQDVKNISSSSKAKDLPIF